MYSYLHYSTFIPTFSLRHYSFSAPALLIVSSATSIICALNLQEWRKNFCSHLNKKFIPVSSIMTPHNFEGVEYFHNIGKAFFGWLFHALVVLKVVMLIL